MKKIMLLGSGELGKEFTIAAKRMGQYVIAVDNYKNAPAMQVADTNEVIDMLDADDLQTIVSKHNPDFIVPEIEAIRTEKLYDFEKEGIVVVPSAKAVNYTMNRKAIRDLAAKDLGLKTAKYEYATTEKELIDAVIKVGVPCVVKPLMSSSGKGQSTVKTLDGASQAWDYAVGGSRGDLIEVIVEEFVPFESEITLLTVTQNEGETLFCAPIGHVQERGDYQQSWQPAFVKPELLAKAQEMAKAVTKELSGAGLWGVEFFLTEDDVYFSELSPRPHDTGMVTLANTQNLNECELHLRSILSIPIPQIDLLKAGASSVILANEHGENPVYHGIEEVLSELNTDVKIFGKTTTRPYRRMGIVLEYDDLGNSIEELTQRAKEKASKIKIDIAI